MTERPILFSGPMVNAILAGRKTQTRRVLAHQITASQTWGSGIPHSVPGRWCVHARFAQPHRKPLVTNPPGSDDAHYPCPYGNPGDLLWVRETWFDNCPDGPPELYYRADAPHDFEGESIERDGGGWRPSIHMPRAYSRITLRITDIRVERLQDITEADARAEGMEPNWGLRDLTGFDPDEHGFLAPGRPFNELGDQQTAREAFGEFWDSIHLELARRGTIWRANPWVWVVSFEKTESNP